LLFAAKRRRYETRRAQPTVAVPQERTSECYRAYQLAGRRLTGVRRRSLLRCPRQGI